MKKFVRLSILTALTLSLSTVTIVKVSEWGTLTVHAEDLDSVNSKGGSGYDALEEAQNKQKANTLNEKQTQNKATNNDSKATKDLFDTSGVDSAQGNFFKKFFPMSNQSLNDASNLLSPLSAIIATCISCILVAIFLFIGLVTALDMLYIMLPFSRSLLAVQNAQPQGGMGGMGMGLGMSMGGQQQQPQKRQWVSDECLQAMAEGGQQQAQGGINGGGVGGIGMGGFGPMGGMGGQQQPMQNRSIPLLYIKKRAFSLVVFGIMAVLLLSSLFTDFGLNIGMMILNLLSKVTNW